MQHLLIYLAALLPAGCRPAPFAASLELLRQDEWFTVRDAATNTLKRMVE